MVKKKVKVDDVERLEKIADELLRNIRDIRYGMSQEKIEELPLQTATARLHLNWLLGWSNKAVGVFKTELGKTRAQERRNEMKKEK